MAGHGIFKLSIGSQRWNLAFELCILFQPNLFPEVFQNTATRRIPGGLTSWLACKMNSSLSSYGHSELLTISPIPDSWPEWLSESGPDSHERFRCVLPFRLVECEIVIHFIFDGLITPSTSTTLIWLSFSCCFSVCNCVYPQHTFIHIDVYSYRHTHA